MNFHERVYKAVALIPVGQVTSYGTIALAVDQPRSARQVGWALAALGPDSSVPWWRVVNRSGFLSIRGHDIAIKEIQTSLLRSENIVVENYTVDMERYGCDVATLLTDTARASLNKAVEID